MDSVKYHSYLMQSNPIEPLGNCAWCCENLNDAQPLVYHESKGESEGIKHPIHLTCIKNAFQENQKSFCPTCATPVDGSSVFSRVERVVMKIKPVSKNILKGAFIAVGIFATVKPSIIGAVLTQALSREYLADSDIAFFATVNIILACSAVIKIANLSLRYFRLIENESPNFSQQFTFLCLSLFTTFYFCGFSFLTERVLSTSFISYVAIGAIGGGLRRV